MRPRLNGAWPLQPLHSAGIVDLGCKTFRGFTVRTGLVKGLGLMDFRIHSGPKP